MQKRGQATLVIILGILIAAAVGAAVYFEGDVLKQRLLSVTGTAVMPETVQLLKDELGSCYAMTAQQGIKLLGQQGGYIFPPADSLQVDTNIISYAYNKKAIVPSTQTMAQELQDYINIMLPLCPEYQLFEDNEIQAGEPQTKVTISDDNVNFETAYIVALKSGDDEYKLSEPYTSTISVRLSKMQDIASQIANRVASKPDEIDPEYLVTLGVPINVVPYDENTAVYIMSDPESHLPIGEEPFLYAFATKK